MSGHGRQEAGGAPLGNVVCDLDGVVYLMDTAVPGAGVALSDIERRGYRLLFATNAAIRTPEGVAAHIASVSGYPAQAAQVVTSAMVAAEVLSAADCPVLVVGEAGLSATLQQSGLRLSDDPREARSVVVGLDRRLTYDRLRVAAAALLRGARFVATIRDPTYPTESGPWPGGGAIVAALEAATGRVAEVVGKPHRPMAEAVVRRLGPGPTWLVGDRPETDLALGRQEGWTTVLVLTGVVSTAADVPAGLRPDLVLATVADLPAHLPG
ncbi:MAG TPA: HAD-IIA family hydrolase [Acidimicrobiia bacterium]|nr:HAD-IIA family hydrolase [Acidimicrobiia bacterium]